MSFFPLILFPSKSKFLSKNENFDKEFKGNLSVSYAYGSHGVEVARETGKIKIVNYIETHDVGKAINLLLLEGQIYGGGIMGIGYALG